MVVDLVAQIDVFLAQPKRLVGIDKPATWQQGWENKERAILIPIEANGEISGSNLRVACLDGFSGEQFRLGLMIPQCISRLDYTDEVHANSLALPEDNLPPIVRGYHYHPWALNKRFFRNVTQATKLRNAKPFSAQQRNFDSILRWFISEHGIESLPANHTIELPRRDWLI